MPRPWKRPTIPPSPLGELNRALHELHHRAGWPSSRQIRQALDDKGVSMSHTKIHDTLTKPVLPAKGAVEMITEVLAGSIRGADVDAEIDRLLALWDDAALDKQAPAAAAAESSTVETPALVEPPCAEKQVGTEEELRTKAQSGDTDAMHDLGVLLRKQGRTDEAMEWHLRAANAGKAESMFRVASRLERDSAYAEALAWYRRAAEAGLPEAMDGLGALLEDFGTQEESMYWFQRAAHAGVTDAMAHLGWYSERQGKPREALTWYRRAVQSGVHDDMYNLGSLLYKLGEREEAEIWLRRAAEMNNAEAMLALSKALRARGDYMEADMWERQAKK